MTLDEVAINQPGAVVPELQHRRVDVGDGYWRCERCRRLEGHRYLHASEVCPTAAMEVVKARDEARRERDELRLTLAAEQGLEEGIPVGWHVTTRGGYGRPTCFAFTARPTLIVYKLAPSDGVGWAWFEPGRRMGRDDSALTARATMLAAAAATAPRGKG